MITWFIRMVSALCRLLETLLILMESQPLALEIFRLLQGLGSSNHEFTLARMFLITQSLEVRRVVSQPNLIIQMTTQQMARRTTPIPARAESQWGRSSLAYSLQLSIKNNVLSFQT